MTAVKGIVRDGRIELNGPVDWPDGSEVLVEPLPNGTGRIGLDESEWRDDPASLADWAAWIKTLEALEFTPEEEAERARFAEAMRRHNVDAVRRQMEGEPLP